MNRNLGRVGLPHGTASVSSSFNKSLTFEGEKAAKSAEPKTYVDNSKNRSLGRVGLPYGKGTSCLDSDGNIPNDYVDNEFNRSVSTMLVPMQLFFSFIKRG